jgi:hypothetical protein
MAEDRLVLASFFEPMLWTFPCGEDKKPRNANGFLGAVQGVWWPKAELVGVTTGWRNDFDVLDIDGDAGRAWYERNYDAIPQTRAHSTQRGMHLLFVHAPGLHCSTSGIAPGIDVRTTGGYCIWWPREGLPIEDHPLSCWPEWLYEEAKGTSRPKRNLSNSMSPLPHVHAEVASLTEALFKLDPVEWRGQQHGGWEESYDAWLALMMACKAAGISKEDWVEWCVGDECYANDEDEIGRKWDGVPARHSGALFKALAARGIRYRQGRNRVAEVSTGAPFRPKGDLRDHTRRLIQHLAERGPLVPRCLSLRRVGDVATCRRRCSPFQLRGPSQRLGREVLRPHHHERLHPHRRKGSATSANTQRTFTMNGKNGHGSLMDFIRDNPDLIRDPFVEFSPMVEHMIARLKVISEDLPRQKEIAATFARGTPSLEWLVQYRRRQFTSLWLEYACLATDAEKDAFCDGLVEWWKLVCANEQRAAEHIAQHKARRLA